MVKKMDAGDILLQKTIPLDGTETTGTLTETAAAEAPAMLLEVLSGLEEGTLEGRPQDHERATFCTLIRKDQGLISWNSEAREIERTVRAYSPRPGAFTSWNGCRLFIRKSVLSGEKGDQKKPPGTVLGVDKKQGILLQTGKDVLAVRELQIQSKKSMDFLSFINGHRDIIGAQLGAE
jgi:methionyl-tRNA formyltransferase